mmetsp:Transcript_7988/g.22951  ORF Transcript_7988/g.22951 Transcript_7988/m.22951 type:complete len:251 (-) Transcript_7988:49-801(-)
MEEEAAIACAVVDGEFRSGSGQAVGEAEQVSQKFEEAGNLLQCVLRALLGGAVGGSLGNHFSVVQVEGNHVQLLRDDHLGRGEVQIPTEVVDVLAVQMPQRHVRHREDWEHVGQRLSRQDEDHGVRQNCADHLVHPLNPHRELEQEGTYDERVCVSHVSVRNLVHDDAERVAQEEAENVRHGVNVHADRIRDDRHIILQERRGEDDRLFTDWLERVDEVQRRVDHRRYCGWEFHSGMYLCKCVDVRSHVR